MYFYAIRIIIREITIMEVNSLNFVLDLLKKFIAYY